LKLKERFLKIAEDFSVELIFLFGSQKEKGYSLLKGEKIRDTDPLADLDVGVVFKKGAFPKKPYKNFGSLYFEFAEIFSPLKIDLVFLQETESVLQFEAIKGICVFKKSREALDDYIERVLKFAADWKVMRDRIDNEFLGLGARYDK